VAVSVTRNEVQAYAWDDLPNTTWDQMDDAWDEAGLWEFLLDASESLGVSDAITKDADLVLSETLNIADDIANAVSFVRTFTESFSLAESYVDYINFQLKIMEHFAISDHLGKDVDFHLSEELSIAEVLSKEVSLNLSELITIGDDFGKSVEFYRTWVESLGITDLTSKQINLEIAESFGIDEKLTRDIGLNKSELLAFADAIGRTTTFVRNFNEGLSIAESMSKAIDLSIAEALAIAEQYMRNSNSVISDLGVGSGDISESDFAEMISRGSAPGYEDFTRFLTGDYDYQKALIRLAVSSENSDRPLIDRMRIDVDVPDVRDSGSQAIDAAGSTISFNRNFSVPPEVGANMKGGTVIGVPYVDNITETDFFVIIKDSAGVGVAGTISWSALGY